MTLDTHSSLLRETCPIGHTLGDPKEHTLSSIQQKHMPMRLIHVASLVNT
jgi:hypothetical protein